MWLKRSLRKASPKSSATNKTTTSARPSTTTCWQRKSVPRRSNPVFTAKKSLFSRKSPTSRRTWTRPSSSCHSCSDRDDATLLLSSSRPAPDSESIWPRSRACWLCFSPESIVLDWVREIAKLVAFHFIFIYFFISQDDKRALRVRLNHRTSTPKRPTPSRRVSLSNTRWKSRSKASIVWATSSVSSSPPRVMSISPSRWSSMVMLAFSSPQLLAIRVSSLLLSLLSREPRTLDSM